MVRTILAASVVVIGSMFVGCAPGTGGDDPPLVPAGSECGSNVVACYDEFARQPSKIICFRQQSRWPTTELTWTIASFFTALDPQDQIDSTDAAMQLWAAASNLSLQRLDSGTADLTISFVDAVHGDDFPFDGPGGILGHAFFPGAGERAGQIHLCRGEPWSLDEDADRVELFTALVHETGHALGLEHSLNEDAVMGPTYMGGITALTADDTAAIQRLYGSPGGAVPPIVEGDPAFDEFCADAALGNLVALGDPDTDGDGVPDTVERFVLDTDPVGADSDGDGASDAAEVFLDRTDPNDVTSFNIDSIAGPPGGGGDVALSFFFNGTQETTLGAGDGATALFVEQVSTITGGLLHILAQRFDETGLWHLSIFMDDQAVLTGTPIPIDQLPGSVQVIRCRDGVSAFASVSNQSAFNPSGSEPIGIPFGDVSLNVAGDRLVGSVDFGFDVLSDTVRIVGELNADFGLYQEAPEPPVTGGCFLELVQP